MRLSGTNRQPIDLQPSAGIFWLGSCCRFALIAGYLRGRSSRLTKGSFIPRVFASVCDLDTTTPASLPPFYSCETNTYHNGNATGGKASKFTATYTDRMEMLASPTYLGTVQIQFLPETSRMSTANWFARLPGEGFLSDGPKLRLRQGRGKIFSAPTADAVADRSGQGRPQVGQGRSLTTSIQPTETADVQNHSTIEAVKAALAALPPEEQIALATDTIDRLAPTQTCPRKAIATPPVAVTVRRNVRAWRRARGFTQAELAKRAGITQPHVAVVEKGKHVPGLDVIERIAKSLRVSPHVLLQPSTTSLR